MIVRTAVQRGETPDMGLKYDAQRWQGPSKPAQTTTASKGAGTGKLPITIGELSSPY
jgi:hypothetical protein